MPERRPATRPRASFGSTIGLIAAVVTLVAAVAFYTLHDTTGPEDPLLCDGSATAGTVHLLLDLRKPMAPGVSATAMREVARRVPAGTELAVYAVGHDPRTPRHHVGRLCRPYDDDVLQVATAKDGGMTPRDCDNLPAQISPALRAAATTYCGERSALARRVDTLNAAAAPRVADAYLVEAIAESVGDLAPRRHPARCTSIRTCCSTRRGIRTWTSIGRSGFSRTSLRSPILVLPRDAPTYRRGSASASCTCRAPG